MHVATFSVKQRAMPLKQPQTELPAAMHETSYDLRAIECDLVSATESDDKTAHRRASARVRVDDRVFAALQLIFVARLLHIGTRQRRARRVPTITTKTRRA
jgi:hypothetical protein